MALLEAKKKKKKKITEADLIAEVRENYGGRKGEREKKANR